MLQQSFFSMCCDNISPLVLQEIDDAREQKCDAEHAEQWRREERARCGICIDQQLFDLPSSFGECLRIV